MITQKLVLGYYSRLASQFITMVAGIVVARLAGPSILGTVAFGMSYVSVFGFVADLGLGSAHVKLVSEGRDLGVCNATFGRIKRILVYTFVGVVILVVLVQYFYYPDAFESPEHVDVILIWLATVALSQLSQIPVSTFSGLTEQAKQDVPAFFQSLLTSALRIAAVLLGLGAIGLSTSNLIGVLLALVAYSLIYRNYPVGRYDAKLSKDYFRLALPIMVMVFCNTQLENLDKVMLQYFSSSEQVGQYVAGSSVSGIVRTVGSTVGLLFFPLFSSAVARHDFQFIDRTINKFERFTYIVIMPCIILGMIYADHIVRILLGARYAPAAPIVAILTAGMFFYVLNMPYGNLLMGMNRFGLAAVLHIANLILFVSLNALILMHLQVEQRALGTSLALSSSTVVLGYGFRIAVWLIRRDVGVWNRERYLAVGIGTAIAGFYLAKIVGVQTSVASALVFPFGFFAVVYGIFFVTKLADRQDIRMALELVNIRKVFAYVRSEFPKE
jgi:O-antigen/teichoic acid export membrane protein